MPPPRDLDLRALLEHRDSLRALARRLVADEGRAEDLLQDAWVVALERRPRGVRSPLGWMKRVLRNAAVDLARRERERPEREERAARWLSEERAAADERESARAPAGLGASGGGARAPGDADAALAAEEALVAALRGLADPYRTTIWLRYWADLTPARIAEREGLPVATVKTRLRRGLERLRAEMDRRHGGDRRAWCAPLLPLAGYVRDASRVAKGGSTMLVKVLLLVGAIGGATALWTSRPEGGPEGGTAESVAHASAELASAPAAASAIPAATMRAPVRTASGASTALAVSAAADEAVLRGRLVLASGAPAVGAVVRVSGGKAGAPRRLVRWDEWWPWTAPEPVTVDGDGSFEVRCAPASPATTVSLETELAEHAPVRWAWDGLAAGSERDLGELVLCRRGTLRVRLAGPLALAVPKTWHASFVAGAWTPEGRRPVMEVAALDEAAEVVFEGVPAGPVRVSLWSAHGVRLEPREAQVADGAETEVELVYDGPDLSRRVSVQLERYGQVGGGTVEPSVVRLVAPGVEAPAFERVPGVTVLTAHDVEPGVYALEVTHPSYESCTVEGVQPGDAVTVEAAGPAAIALEVRDAASGAPLEPYALQITYRGVMYSPNTFQLRAPGADAPEGHVYAELSPGDVTLHVDVPGRARVSVDVDGLAAGAPRGVVVDVATGARLAGVVTGAICAGVEIELTEGTEPGDRRPGRVSGTADGGLLQPPLVGRVVATDAGGAFAFESLAPGDWHLRARWSPWLVADQGVTLGDADVTDVELARPPAGSLGGSLLLPAEPLVGEVELQLGKVGRSHEVELDAGGAFGASDLPAGPTDLSAMVVVSANGRGHGGSFPLGAVAIPAGGAVEHTVDFRASFPGVLFVTVRMNGVVPEAEPFQRVFVEPTPLGGRCRAGSGVDEEGRFFHPVAPGSYELRLKERGREGTWAWTHPEPVEVGANQEVHVTADVPLVARTVELRDAAGALLPDTELVWTTDLEGAAHAARATVGADGRIALELPAASTRFARAGSAAAKTLEWSPALLDPVVLELE